MGPFGNVDPRTGILWFTYVITINFANLLAIFVMMGVLSRDLENRRVDILLARPVSRGQRFFGKLLGGWASIVVFMALVVVWTYICMLWGGVGFEPKYIKAFGVGIVSPLLISSMTLFLSIWMKGMLAGFLTIVMNIGASAPGTFMVYVLGHDVLKLDKMVKVILRILLLLNVIGHQASSFLEKDLILRIGQAAFSQYIPANSGLYSEMWHVRVYFGIVIVLGWASMFRRQFT